MPTATAAGQVHRTGSIHSFAPGMPGPTIEEYEKNDLPRNGVPVEVIDAELLSVLGKGRLVGTHFKDDHLIGTVEWSKDVDDLTNDYAGDAEHGRPAAHCVWGKGGVIKKVIVEVLPKDAGEDSDHDDCECGGHGTCQCPPEYSKPDKSDPAEIFKLHVEPTTSGTIATPSKASTSSPRRTVIAIVSTDSVDRSSDVMVPSGCRFDNYLKNPVLCLVHDTRRIPVGKCIRIGPSADGRRIEAEFEWAPPEVEPLATQVAEAYDQGFMRGFSIGFKPHKYAPPTKADILRRPDWDKAARIFWDWELLEISAVAVPDNQDALKKAAAIGPELSEYIKAVVKYISLSKELSESSGTSGGYTVADDEKKEPEKAKPGVKPGDHVKWDYAVGKGKESKKCMGYGKVKSCHCKGEDMPDADNMDDGSDGGESKAAQSKPPKDAMKCPYDGALVKCYGMKGDGKDGKGGKWEPTGSHEFHAIEKMTVLHDGLPSVGGEGGEAKSSVIGTATIKVVADMSYFDAAMERGNKQAENVAPVTSKSLPPIIKSMLGGPFGGGYGSDCSPAFGKWEEQAIISALDSIHWRKQSAICSVICSDMLDPSAKVDMVRMIIDAYKPVVLKLISSILDVEDEDAATKAARALAIIAAHQVKSIEAPYRTASNNTPNDDAATADSFAEWFDATASVAKELREALVKRIETRLKAGRVLSEATLGQINSAIEACTSATDALVTLRDSATKPKVVEGSEAGKGDDEVMPKANTSTNHTPPSAAQLKSDAIRRRAELRRSQSSRA